MCIAISRKKESMGIRSAEAGDKVAPCLNSGNENDGMAVSASQKTLELMLSRIAPTNLPVLLVGESGTGKAFLAHCLHDLSLRRQEPFVTAICSGFTAEAVNQHFTGNGRDAAPGGTLFLRELSELSSASQSGLLCSIVKCDSGDTEGQSREVRLISSTTVDLEDESASRRFRRDLYYRLKGVCLHLAPLRERKEDIPGLVETFLQKHSLLQGKTRPNLDAEDLERLQAWHWPGNIRELDNIVRQIVILSDTKSILEEFVTTARGDRKPLRSGGRLALKAATRQASRKVEEQLILDALAKTRWNRKRAAQELQISYKSLLSKLKQIGSDKPGKL
jgi:two-component system response regulator AtoC